MPGRAVAPFAGAWIEITWSLRMASMSEVAPFAGAWIEMPASAPREWRAAVAPFAGAWIEIFVAPALACKVAQVAPFAGAWIEIADLPATAQTSAVAPFTGAWIEIPAKVDMGSGASASLRGLKFSIGYASVTQPSSLPSRERGLKLLGLIGTGDGTEGRSLRGSVD